MRDSAKPQGFVMVSFATKVCLKGQKQYTGSETQKGEVDYVEGLPGTITSNKGTQTALGKKHLDLHSLLRKVCGFMTYSEVRLLEQQSGPAFSH